MAAEPPLPGRHREAYHRWTDVAAHATDHNVDLWRRGSWVAAYDNVRLSAAERAQLRDHRVELSSRVLEIGPGAGRLTAQLAESAATLTAFEISPAMAEACRQRVPSADVQVRDMRDLDDIGDASLDAVVAGCNVIDVLEHEQRLAFLRQTRAKLAPGGVLLFCTHNRDHRVRRPWQPPAWRRPSVVAATLAGLPANLSHHRRMRRHETERADYALRNDEAHGFTLIHYYIGADAQRRQLETCGFRLEDCMTDDAIAVDPQGIPSVEPFLHYSARAA